MPFASITGGGMAFCSMLGAISLRRPHRARVSESREPAAGVSARVRTGRGRTAATVRRHARMGGAGVPTTSTHDDVAMEHCQDDVREAV